MNPQTIDTEELKEALSDPNSIPGAKKLIRWGLVMKLSHSPAFEKSTVWFLLSDSRPASGRRAISRRVHFGPSENGKIEYLVDDVILHPEELDEITNKLRNKALIPFPEHNHWGLDGETFGVEIPSFDFYYKWWSEGPKENREFIDTVTQIRQWAERKHEIGHIQSELDNA